MDVLDQQQLASVRAQVAGIQWYHTIDLAPGVVTPGWLDHRSIVPRIPLPSSLAGRRCLDVGTFNGFWAFEMERRGGDVTAVDVLDPRAWDWPPGSDPEAMAEIGRRMSEGDGFAIARSALGADVARVDRNVYDLDPAELGTFDLIYLGSLLIHLRDPVRALAGLRELCAGTLVVVDGIDLPLSVRSPRLPVARLDGQGRPWWWYPNVAALRRMIEDAGFELVSRPRMLFVQPGEGWAPPRVKPSLLRSREGRYWLTAAWLGDPHAVIVARPRSAASRARLNARSGTATVPGS
jgi:tRNA (mo5U34)-methyltransferase